MNFTTRNSLGIEQKTFINLLKYHAISTVLNTPYRANEVIIDDFLQKNYKMSLHEVCYKIIKNLEFGSYDGGNTYIVTPKSQKLKKLAQLITYGDGTFFGSKILVRAIK